MTDVVFYVFAAVAVLSGAMCILQRSPVASVLWLVQVMLSLAAIYLLLGAQFIAAIQILIYAGAVMVLFLFVIMLLNLGREPSSDLRGPASLAAGLVVVGLLAIELGALWTYTPRRLVEEVARTAGRAALSTSLAAGSAAREAAAANGVVGGIAAPLFQAYLVPFEVTSVLLLAAIVGAVVLAKRRA